MRQAAGQFCPKGIFDKRIVSVWLVFGRFLVKHRDRGDARTGSMVRGQPPNRPATSMQNLLVYPMTTYPVSTHNTQQALLMPMDNGIISPTQKDPFTY